MTKKREWGYKEPANICHRHISVHHGTSRLAVVYPMNYFELYKLKFCARWTWFDFFQHLSPQIVRHCNAKFRFPLCFDLLLYKTHRACPCLSHWRNLASAWAVYIIHMWIISCGFFHWSDDRVITVSDVHHWYITVYYCTDRLKNIFHLCVQACHFLQEAVTRTTAAQHLKVTVARWQRVVAEACDLAYTSYWL